MEAIWTNAEIKKQIKLTLFKSGFQSIVKVIRELTNSVLVLVLLRFDTGLVVCCTCTW